MKQPAELIRHTNWVWPAPSAAGREHAAMHPQAEANVPSLDGARGQDLSQVPVRSACPAAPSRCPFGGACHTCPLPIQAKQTISQPSDHYEQEADRAAGQALALGHALLHRRPTRRAASWNPADKVEVVTGEGQPLPSAERKFFEGRFGYDFGPVRVHTDSRAAQSAQAIGARAYTFGHDIVFAAGQYRPETEAGRALLAHELVHTVQQAQAETEGIQREEAAAAVTCDRDVLEEARMRARERVYRAEIMAGSLSPEPVRQHTLQVARNLIAPDITLQRVESVLRGMRFGLGPDIRCGPEIPQCNMWDAYQPNDRPFIHTCNSFFDLDFEMQVRKLIHESAHVAGIGYMAQEAYLMNFDCQTSYENESYADAWAHFVHCLLGFAPDEIPEEDVIEV